LSFIYNFLNCTVDTVDTQTKPTPIPICEEAKEKFNCNADWLSRILGLSIKSFNIKPVGGGMSTQAYRLSYTTEENMENSVFVKYIIQENDRPFFLRLLSILGMLTLDLMGRKETFFYSQLCPSFNSANIRTPHPLYVALEGKVVPILDLMGFQADLRGVLFLEDLGKCESFAIGTALPEKYSTYLSAKLAQLHALNWYKPIHPEIPSQNLIPEAYVQFFQLYKRNFLSKNLTKEEMIKQLELWKNDCAFLQEPVIRDALIAFSEHKDMLLKYDTNYKLQSSPLFQHLTFLHGDFHCGNVLFITEPSEEDPETKNIKDSVVIDWQCYGYGHPSTEFSYFIANVDHDPDMDLKLMKIYYEELTKTVKPEEYPWEVFQREVEIRNVQLVIAGFNLVYRNTPEDFKKWKFMFEKRGVDMDNYFNSYRTKYLRMAHILEKWTQENILERIEEF